MVQISALDILDAVPAAQLWPLVAPLLSDAVGGVRIRAASLLMRRSSASQPASRPRALRPRGGRIRGRPAPQRRSSGSARDAQAFLARRGAIAEAEAEYRAALRLDPQLGPAAINLADFYRRLGRETDEQGAARRTPRRQTMQRSITRSA